MTERTFYRRPGRSRQAVAWVRVAHDLTNYGSGMAAEEAHEIGRAGVMDVKHFLESTTYLHMPWTAYDHGRMCKLQRSDGTKKQYDLRGYFLGQRRRNLYVEAKKYSTPGGQGAKYREFLADIYSIIDKLKSDDMDDDSEFMWITWHPFSLGEWTRLTSYDYIEEAVAQHPRLIGCTSVEEAKTKVDVNRCRELAERLWVIVLSDRQYELVMSPDDVRKTLTSLRREGA